VLVLAFLLLVYLRQSYNLVLVSRGPDEQDHPLENNYCPRLQNNATVGSQVGGRIDNLSKKGESSLVYSLALLNPVPNPIRPMISFKL
jgi:hypothetical protein